MFREGQTLTGMHMNTFTAAPIRALRTQKTWRHAARAELPTRASGHCHPTLSRGTIHSMTCRCTEGWVCEKHPDQPMSHDDCDGAGMRCPNPDCPWWRGPRPAALVFDDEEPH